MPINNKKGTHKPRVAVARNTTRVLLVDDHPVVLEGIMGYVRGRRNIKVVGLASNGLEAVQMARTIRPDLVIVDLSLPQLNGLEVLTRMRDNDPAMKFIVYTMHDRKEFVEEAKRAGADGYLLKSSSPRELIHAIERVVLGMSYFDSEVPRLKSDSVIELCFLNVATEPSGLEKGNDLTLTPRERQILSLMSDGLSVKLIAARLGLSPKTMISHSVNIYRKLGVHTRGEAVAKAIRKYLM